MTKKHTPRSTVLPALAASLAMAVAALPAVAANPNDAKPSAESTKGGTGNPCAGADKCKNSNNPCAGSNCKRSKASNPCAGK